jgi:hypothetical protein
VNEKNIARQRCLQTRTRASQEYYSQKRINANKVFIHSFIHSFMCKQKKKIWLNNKIKQIEEAHKQNNARKFFEDIKSFQGGKSTGIGL